MRERIVEVIKGELEKRQEIVLAYVFGSVAKGSVSEGSDIDIAVLVSEARPDPLRYRVRLIEDLMRVSNGVPVEVVLLEDVPPALGGRIVREGKLLVCRDEADRVRTEVAMLQREFDTAPLRKVLDEAQSQAIRATSPTKGD